MALSPLCPASRHSLDGSILGLDQNASTQCQALLVMYADELSHVGLRFAVKAAHHHTRIGPLAMACAADSSAVLS